MKANLGQVIGEVQYDVNSDTVFARLQIPCKNLASDKVQSVVDDCIGKCGFDIAAELNRAGQRGE